MKTLNLIALLFVTGTIVSCSKSNSTALKPVATTASAHSLVADSVSIYAGSLTANPVVTNGTRLAAIFSEPIGMTMDGSGNLYVAEYIGDDIRKITPDGMVSTVSTGMDMPDYMAIDATGNLYVTFNQVDKVASNGSRNMVSNANAIGLTADASGTVYGATPTQVMKMDPSSGKMVAYAGTTTSGTTDGALTAASFTNIQSLTADASGNLFIVDNNSIREINVSKGTVQTLALKGAALADPQGIAVDQWDNVYVANYGTNAHGFISKITPDGTVSNFAGNMQMASSAAGLQGPAQSVSFNGALGILLLPSGKFLVSSYGNVIQEISTHQQ